MNLQSRILFSFFTIFVFCTAASLKSYAAFSIRSNAILISITTCQNLENIGQITSEPLNGSYVLASNIDCTASYSWNGGLRFTPIGSGNTSTTAFTGTFDGGGYTVSNIYMDYSSNNPRNGLGIALFGEIMGATIKNVNLTNIIIKAPFAGGSDVGALVGDDWSQTTPSTISNVNVSGKLSSAWIGGIIGNAMNVNLSQSSFIGSIEGYYAGGLVGAVESSMTISNSYAQAALVSISNYEGSTGSPSLGGLIGTVRSTLPAGISLTNSYSASSFSYPAVATLTNIGSYGGLVGFSLNFPLVDIVPLNCFYDNQYARQNIPEISPSDPLGLTTVAMKTKAAFTNWDFNATWNINTGIDYPYLQSSQMLAIPTGLTATVLSTSKINLSWTAPTNNPSAVTGYTVFRNGVDVATVTTGTAYSDTGLAAGTTYTYAVSAYNSTGNNSAQSASVTATTQAAPVLTPDGTTLSPGSSGSLVTTSGTWTFGSGDVILQNGNTVTGGVANLLLVYNSGQLYAEYNNVWYQWGQPGWTTLGIDPRTTLTPDGTILTQGSAGSLVTTSGTWTFGSGDVILQNGNHVTGGVANQLLVYSHGLLYDEYSGIWYQWNGSGWTTLSSDPRGSVTETIMPSAGNNGTISPSAAVGVRYGVNQTFAFTPSTGYVSYVSVDGATAVPLPSNSYTFTDVIVTHTIAASFIAVTPDGTTLSPGSTGSLVTTSGVWTFGTGDVILQNGNHVTGGVANLLLVYNGGQLYAEYNGIWYLWNGSGWTTETSFTPPNVTLTIAYTGAAVSSVTSTPAGINCNNNSVTPGTCSAPFPLGSTVQLAATKGAGMFAWGAGTACSNSATLDCSLYMGSSLTVPIESTK